MRAMHREAGMFAFYPLWNLDYKSPVAVLCAGDLTYLKKKKGTFFLCVYVCVCFNNSEETYFTAAPTNMSLC